MICRTCQQDLPESEFYPSVLERGWHICKKCHNKKTAPSIKKYQESLKKLDDMDFNKYFGGYVIKILNFPRKGEYKYSIKTTNGDTIQTNNAKEFFEKLKNILTILEKSVY